MKLYVAIVTSRIMSVTPSKLRLTQEEAEIDANHFRWLYAQQNYSSGYTPADVIVAEVELPENLLKGEVNGENSIV